MRHGIKQRTTLTFVQVYAFSEAGLASDFRRCSGNVPAFPPPIRKSGENDPNPNDSILLRQFQMLLKYPSPIAQEIFSSQSEIEKSNAAGTD